MSTTPQYVVDESSNTIMKEEQHLFDNKVVVGLIATGATIAVLLLMSVFKKRCLVLGKVNKVKLSNTMDLLQDEARDRFKAAQKASQKASKKALKANKKQFKAARKALRKKSKQVSDFI